MSQGKAGGISYSLNGQKLGELPVITNGSVGEVGYGDYLKDLFYKWLLSVKDKPDDGIQPFMKETIEEEIGLE